jgi:hypothetical protein
LRVSQTKKTIYKIFQNMRGPEILPEADAHDPKRLNKISLLLLSKQLDDLFFDAWPGSVFRICVFRISQESPGAYRDFPKRSFLKLSQELLPN